MFHSVYKSTWYEWRDSCTTYQTTCNRSSNKLTSCFAAALRAADPAKQAAAVAEAQGWRCTSGARWLPPGKTQRSQHPNYLEAPKSRTKSTSPMRTPPRTPLQHTCKNREISGFDRARSQTQRLTREARVKGFGVCLGRAPHRNDRSSWQEFQSFNKKSAPTSTNHDVLDTTWRKNGAKKHTPEPIHPNIQNLRGAPPKTPVLRVTRMPRAAVDCRAYDYY